MFFKKYLETCARTTMIGALSGSAAGIGFSPIEFVKGVSCSNKQFPVNYFEGVNQAGSGALYWIMLGAFIGSLPITYPSFIFYSYALEFNQQLNQAEKSSFPKP